MKKQNKYNYLWVLQGNYGHGWADLGEYDTFREARDDLKCYRKNEKCKVHRIIHTRELKQPIEITEGV